MLRIYVRVLLVLTLLVSLVACAQGDVPARPTVPPTALSQAKPTPAPTSRPADGGTPAPDQPPTDAPASPAGFARPLTLNDGDRIAGDDVKLVQQRLLELGYSQVGEADGSFGPATASAVEQFQAANQLTVDGVVDEPTWAAIFSPDAVAGSQPDPPPGRPGKLAGTIFFLASDGVTIQTMQPNGSEVTPLLTIERPDGSEFAGMNADPTGRYLVYGVRAKDSAGEADFYLVENGVAEFIGQFRQLPRWEPDGTRLVGQAFDPNVASGASNIALYDVAIKQFSGLAIDGPADWFPDGNRLVYVQDDNIWAIELLTEETIQLTTLPDADANPWYVQEAHVTPDGQSIVFYAAQQQNVGASGNGMQWWRIPAGGGEAEPYTEPNGNGVASVAWHADVMAFIESAHESACVTRQLVWRLPQADQARQTTPTLDRLAPDEAFSINGLTWAPDGGALAFGVAPYMCSPDLQQLVQGEPRIFIWQPGTSKVAVPIIDGAYPVWTK